MKIFFLSNYYYFVTVFTALYCMVFIAFLSGKYPFSRASRAFALFLVSVFIWSVKDSLIAVLFPDMDAPALMRANAILSPLYCTTVVFCFSMFVSIYNTMAGHGREFRHERLAQTILISALAVSCGISIWKPSYMYASFHKGAFDYHYEPGYAFAVLSAAVVVFNLVPALILMVKSRARIRSEAFIIPLGGILSLAAIVPCNILALNFGIESFPRLGVLSLSVMCAFAFYGIRRYGIAFSVRQVMEERDKLQMIGESLTRLANTTDEKELCQSICDYAQEISESIYVCLAVFGDDYKDYEIRGASYSEQALKDTVFSRLPLAPGTRYRLRDDSVFARQILDGNPFECSSIAEFFAGKLDVSLAERLNRTGHIGQILSYPVILDKTVKGCIVLFRGTAEGSIALYRIFAAQCSLALAVSSHIRELEEKRRLEEMLHQSHKMDALGQLAGGVTHDLNNMLAGISGYIDIIRRNFAKDNPRLSSYIDTMSNASEKASDLISKLLTFARKGKYQVIPVNVHRLISDVIQLLEHTIDKRIEIVQQIHADPPFVMGDPAQVQNAILNLALNARDAMPSGGSLTFSTSVASVRADDTRYLTFAVKDGEYLVIGVKDTGVGMTKDVLAHIYEPFFTTKGIGKGTGLGLSSVYGCVKNHGGYIVAESVPGKGTTFTVYLPLLRSASAAQVSSSVAAPHAMPDKADARKGHIIVIDDEPIVRDLCSTMLGDFGYAVTPFGDARDAIAYYEKCHQDISLAIIDMIMPHMNGSECFSELYRINPAIKAILATGYDISERTQKVLSRNICGFLQKPFKESTLIKMIEDVLESPAHGPSATPLRG